MTDKICKDCKHYRLDGRQPAGSQHRCNRPIVNIVTGESKPHDTRCEDERMTSANLSGACCGPTGSLWESRV